MSHFELFHTLNLSNFVVNIYNLDPHTSTSSTSDPGTIDKDAIDALTDVLNTKQFPREIVEALENLQGVFKIEVSDYEGNILLNSEVFL